MSCTDCPLGQYQGATAQASCSKCEPGSYNSKSGSASCSDCVGDFYSWKEASTCELCLLGYYYSVEQECVECPVGTVCSTDGNATQVDLEIQEKWWRISSTSTVVHKCPLLESCKGGKVFQDGGNGYCKTGFEGVLCASCSLDYYYSPEDNTCYLCETVESFSARLKSSPQLIGFSLLLVILLLFGISKACGGGGDSLGSSNGESAVATRATANNRLKHFHRVWARLSTKLKQSAPFRAAQQLFTKQAKIQLKCLTSFTQIRFFCKTAWVLGQTLFLTDYLPFFSLIFF